MLILNDRITPAVGEITHLSGRILDVRGEPLKNATIEIWQCDASQVYLHSSDSTPKKAQRDANFKGSVSLKRHRMVPIASEPSNRFLTLVVRHLISTSRSSRMIMNS
ncbi:MAG: hypothetical protein U0905_18135 [Pirellulales bacterium]